MIKNLKDWEISKKLKNAIVNIRHFGGAKVRRMKYHNETIIKRKTSSHNVLYFGTSDLDSDQPPDLIAKSINVASSIKDENMMSLFLIS